MMRKKACRNDKYFVEGDECPICHSSNFSTNWQGRLFIFDTKKSTISQKIGTPKEGEYAIKVK
ncbi:MAG TPA: transcription elongation factor subunit Spt4 [Candidatus Nanoarchaeia archaeon]|nr:transcription elongation factor subunit Spt4 [Candidatus Nanoarchaeia archaeon]